MGFIYCRRCTGRWLHCLAELWSPATVRGRALRVLRDTRELPKILLLVVLLWLGVVVRSCQLLGYLDLVAELGCNVAAHGCDEWGWAEIS